MAKTKQDFTRLNSTMSFRVSKDGDKSDAETCRKNGWTVGTRLVVNEGYGPTVIELTAVGERSILAKAISYNGAPDPHPYERDWTLSCREWSKVE